jgi:hypothetical protein
MKVKEVKVKRESQEEAERAIEEGASPSKGNRGNGFRPNAWVGQSSLRNCIPGDIDVLL